MSSVTFGAIPNYVPSTQALDTGADASGSSFSDVLKNAVNTVDSLNDNASAQVNTLLQGGGGADINSVMIAVEKADVSFQLMMQVRNKIVNAYQDIEKMQF
jgi:flagellar hook-basal body complex protein FliE